MKEGIIKDAYELIIKEIQTIITIAYLFIVAIGMLFTFQKYSQFGINIFDYADVFDFLIAPFSDFKIVFFSIITIGLIVILINIDIKLEKKFPKTYSKLSFGWNTKKWFNNTRYYSFVILTISYLYLAANNYGKHTMKLIKKSAPITLKYSDNETVKGIVIGKTKDVLFLLQNEKVKAIPIGSVVKEFEIK